MSRFIKYYDMSDHWVFENSDYFKWWTDLLILASWENRSFLIKGTLIECKRGQLAWSQESLSKRWKTTRQCVRTFLRLLEKDCMVIVKTNQHTSIITICNYDKFQNINKEANQQVTKSKPTDNQNSTNNEPTPKHIQESNRNNRNKKLIEVIKYLKTLSDKSDVVKNKIPLAEQTDSLDGSEPEIVKQTTEKDFPDAKPDTNRDNLAKKNDYPEDFEKAWQLYPKRLGDNPKSNAFTQWKIRLREGDTVEQMTDGIARYQKFCVATGKVGTEAVKHAATFLGQQKAYKETWDLPIKPLGSWMDSLNNVSAKYKVSTADIYADF